MLIFKLLGKFLSKLKDKFVIGRMFLAIWSFFARPQCCVLFLENCFVQHSWTLTLNLLWLLWSFMKNTLRYWKADPRIKRCNLLSEDLWNLNIDSTANFCRLMVSTFNWTFISQHKLEKSKLRLYTSFLRFREKLGVGSIEILSK